MDPREALYSAVKYALDRGQTDPDFGYYCGPGTEVFHRLVVAEAAHLGQPLEEVEGQRGRSLIPKHRRQEPEVELLRTKLQELQR